MLHPYIILFIGLHVVLFFYFSQYTPTILVLFTIVISVKQYVGAPIDCWCPAQFTEAHIDYTNKICWVNNTYYVSFDEPLPLTNQTRRFISYYQWVPFILLTQAMFFYSPCLLWRFVLINCLVCVDRTTLLAPWLRPFCQGQDLVPEAKSGAKTLTVNVKTYTCKVKAKTFCSRSRMGPRHSQS